MHVLETSGCPTKGLEVPVRIRDPFANLSITFQPTNFADASCAHFLCIFLHDEYYIKSVPNIMVEYARDT